MIEIKNRDSYFSLQSLRYQYPNDNLMLYDLNWINIEIEVKTHDLEWKAQDPALLSWEVKETGEWFHKVSKREVPENELLIFIEPCISFRYSSRNKEEVNLSVIIGYELCPKTVMYDEEIIITFILSNEELEDISEAFMIEYEKFPKREEKIVE